MKKKFLLILVIIVNLTIWINSLMPGEISSTQSGFVADVLYPPFAGKIDYNVFSSLIRKIAHFIEFFVLSFLLTFLYKDYQLKMYFVFALVHGIVVAIIDEIIQIFVPNRAGQFIDVLIDTSGTITGILLALVFVKIITKIKGR